MTNLILCGIIREGLGSNWVRIFLEKKGGIIMVSNFEKYVPGLFWISVLVLLVMAGCPYYLQGSFFAETRFSEEERCYLLFLGLIISLFVVLLMNERIMTRILGRHSDELGKAKYLFVLLNVFLSYLLELSSSFMYKKTMVAFNSSLMGAFFTFVTIVLFLGRIRELQYMLYRCILKSLPPNKPNKSAVLVKIEADVKKALEECHRITPG